jgi:hypothetical protein
MSYTENIYVKLCLAAELYLGKRVKLTLTEFS